MRSWLVPALLLGACRVHPDYSNTHYRCDDGICPSGFTCVAGTCEANAQAIDGGGDDGPDAAPDALTGLPWWDPAFTKRARLTITNNSSTTMVTGFQVGVFVDLDVLDSAT